MPNLYLDLSSIAKGFGVDKLAEHLESLGLANYLVEIGGELRGKGKIYKVLIGVLRLSSQH
ncbi:thiamine biosynthesis lipoprotein [Actinobacillus equuli]|nr:thiamine biosynthesis lipoprotein [Actinobacillus equuli]